MTIREALEKVRAYSPLPFGRGEQALVKHKKRTAALARMRTWIVLLLTGALVITCALLPNEALAADGYWKYESAETSSVMGKTSYVYHWYEHRETGSDVDMFDSTHNDVYERAFTTDGEPQPSTWGKPEDGADWNDITLGNYLGGPEVASDDSILGNWDAAKKEFENNETPDLLKQPLKGIIYLLCSFAGKVSMWCLDQCVLVLELVDVKTLLLSSFSEKGGTFTHFYDQANAITSKIATPLGSAFMTLAFVLHVIKLTDSRRYGGQAWVESLMRTVAFYLVASALVANSMQLSGAIYEVAKRTAGAVDAALGGGGMASLTVLGQNLETGMASAMSAVTYDDWYRIFPAVIVVFLCMGQIFNFAITVFTTCFLRMVEIYLRSAFMPIPLSLLVNEDMRPIGVSYLKRFAGCCFMAGVFVAALGLTNALASTVAGIFITASKNVEGLASIVATAAPIIITLSSLDAIIKKSGEIANNLFGM